MPNPSKNRKPHRQDHGAHGDVDDHADEFGAKPCVSDDAHDDAGHCAGNGDGGRALGADGKALDACTAGGRHLPARLSVSRGRCRTH